MTTELSGERLDHESALYGADLVRHRVAYVFAGPHAAGRRVLDLGCGTGYGAAELAQGGAQLVAVDRAVPVASARRSSARFVRAGIAALPFPAQLFDLVVSFQVIEHLEDPRPYLESIARLLRPDGVALVSTPNILQSERENPYHLHEYEAAELGALLHSHFDSVEVLGVGAVGEAARYHEGRLRQIRRITRLDPLGLRKRLPRPVVDWLFARLSIVVRFVLSRGRTTAPQITIDEFPIGPADAACLDLLAVCRKPRNASEREGAAR
jgi:SAM-dependent methyltransferase